MAEPPDPLDIGTGKKAAIARSIAGTAAVASAAPLGFIAGFGLALTAAKAVAGRAGLEFVALALGNESVQSYGTSEAVADPAMVIDLRSQPPGNPHAGTGALFSAPSVEESEGANDRRRRAANLLGDAERHHDVDALLEAIGIAHSLDLNTQIWATAAETLLRVIAQEAESQGGDSIDLRTPDEHLASAIRVVCLITPFSTDRLDVGGTSRPGPSLEGGAPDELLGNLLQSALLKAEVVGVSVGLQSMDRTQFQRLREFADRTGITDDLRRQHPAATEPQIAEAAVLIADVTCRAIETGEPMYGEALSVAERVRDLVDGSR